MGRGCASYARIHAFVACVAACCVVVVPHAAASQVLAGAGETEATPRLLPADVGWTVDLGAGPLFAPAWDSRTVYVALRTGWLTAVDLQSGETVWSVEQPADQPPVTGEQLVVVADGPLLTARRTADGVPHWTRSFETPVAGPLFFEAGWLVAATATGDLLALRGLDGGEVWRQPLGATPTARPSLAGEHLYVPLDDGRVVALALATGALLWESPFTGQPQEILPSGALFVGSTDHHLYRLALADGDHDWYWRTGGDIVGAPASDDERVYFTARDNVLRALDRRNGARRWRTFLEHRPTSGPILAGSLLLVTGVSESAYLFDAETGLAAGHYDAPGELAAPPYLIPARAPDATGESSPEPHLVLITTDGHLIGLTPPAGPPRITISFPPQPLLPLPDRLAPAAMTEWHPLRMPVLPMLQ